MLAIARHKAISIGGERIDETLDKRDRRSHSRRSGRSAGHSGEKGHRQFVTSVHPAIAPDTPGNTRSGLLP
jgi:hypothetical protein